MRNIPGLDVIVDFVNIDKGVQRAAENGLSQHIGKSAEDKGLKLTIDNVILDRKRLVIAYSVVSDRSYEIIHPFCEILKKDGTHVEGGYSNKLCQY